MSRKDHITKVMLEVDERLLKQPMWVQELVNTQANQIAILERRVDEYQRESSDSDGMVRRGYALAGAGEFLPSHDTYFFKVGDLDRDTISVRLEDNKLHVSGGVDVLKIQPQSYNAFYIYAEK